MKFIFRNNTVEQFFDSSYKFSGYDDISFIPQNAEAYVWFYQVPIDADSQRIAKEVESFYDKLCYVHSNIPTDRTLIVFTMVDYFRAKIVHDDFVVESAVRAFNDNVTKLSRCYDNIKIADISHFTRQYKCEELIDWKYYFISQTYFNPRLAKPFKKWFAQFISSVELKRKKCLVLDLDNTLWGGVLGEDGAEGIKIGGDYPGKAFSMFQKSLVELCKTGVILTVCSKNNESDVRYAWDNNPYIILTDRYISAYRINWDNKADNIIELSKELNIGLDSFVFVDDNPTERELIRQTLPMIAVPEFPSQAYELPAFFRQLVDNYFQVYSITNEDKQKTEQYKANAERAKMQKQFVNISEFIRSLDIEMTVERANQFTIPRIAQMTQKTNQFNLTTKRYTESDIKMLIEKGCKIWSLSVRDKFGDNGITGCLILDNNNNIDTLLLSCRILGKNIESAFVKSILSQCCADGIDTIYASYLPTPKNSQVEKFYEKCGFELVETIVSGEKKYKIKVQRADLSIEDYYNINILM